MFDIDINQENSSIRIKQKNSTIVAEGRFAIDRPDHTALVRIIDTTIASDDDQKLHNLISVIHKWFYETYSAGVVLRFPASFDNKIDRNKPELKNSVSTFMTVNISDLKYENDDLIEYDREQYALVTDKQSILIYAKQIMTMIIVEAFWAEHWDEQEVHDRILSASAVAMIIDKMNKVPVGFGRMFMMRNKNNNEEETLGFLSDVAVTLSHQGKGLGRVIINYLAGAYAGQRQASGSLCLMCADRGSGAIFGPKLYKRLGFKHLDKIGNQIAIFSLEK
jgi:GNAT superfamily N-acetyltransferase